MFTVTVCSAQQKGKWLSHQKVTFLILTFFQVILEAPKEDKQKYQQGRSRTVDYKNFYSI